MHHIIISDKLSFVITIVEINDHIQKRLDQDIKNGMFDPEVRELIAYWAMEIKEIGYEKYLAQHWPSHSTTTN